MQRLERLLATAEELRRHAPQPVSASRLADRFAVSRRTVERDLAALRESGLPLRSEQGRDGGTVTLEVVDRGRVVLTAPQVMALAVAVEQAGEGTPWREDAVAALDRITDALPAATRAEAARLRGQARLARVPGPAGPPPEVRRAVEDALSVTYVDASGRVTRRDVEPVGLLHAPSGWYVIAWCVLRGDRRLFRLDRLRQAAVTDRPCAERDVDEVLGEVPHELARL